MQLLRPEIMTDLVRDMPVTASITGLLVGLLLWLVGWWGHRFWIVLIATAGAGIAGLYVNATFGAKALIQGLLLAIAAGTLALALVRVVAFAAGGFAVWLAVRSLVPAWDDPLTCFLIGGLAGLLLFRLWTMALTSLAGTLLMVYFGLCLADRLGKLDAVALCETRTALLNWSCAGVAVMGLLIQWLMDRLRHRRRRERGDEEPLLDEVEYEDPRERKARWTWGRRSYRRAG